MATATTATTNTSMINHAAILRESMEIFERHYPNGCVMDAEDGVLIGPAEPFYNSADGRRLQALGWMWDDSRDSWMFDLN